jgi:hypothetical protein
MFAVLVLLPGCAGAQPPQKITSAEGMSCASTCVAPGLAATAGHCVGRYEPIVTLPQDCRDVATRAALQGEPVEVRGYALGLASARTSTIVESNWLGWLIVSGRGIPGESGGGVYGTDGDLLGVVVETRDGVTYARRIEVF